MNNGIIYSIINKVNGKRYVGQTFVGLKKRYAGAWWKNGHNPYLRFSVEKHGIDNFEWEILESGIDSIDKLNELEIFYSQKFDCHYPKGYNIRQCGGNRALHQETRQKISKANSKEVTLKDVYGNVFQIPNLRDFCNERGLNRSAIANLICGISDYSQGYVRIDADLSKIPKAKKYKFLSPFGEVIEDTLAAICSKYQLKSWTLKNLTNGRLKKSKGWVLLT